MVKLPAGVHHQPAVLKCNAIIIYDAGAVGQQRQDIIKQNAQSAQQACTSPYDSHMNPAATFATPEWQTGCRQPAVGLLLAQQLISSKYRLEQARHQMMLQWIPGALWILGNCGLVN
jgi:hypothetical protein